MYPFHFANSKLYFNLTNNKKKLPSNELTRCIFSVTVKFAYRHVTWYLFKTSMYI